MKRWGIYRKTEKLWSILHLDTPIDYPKSALALLHLIMFRLLLSTICGLGLMCRLAFKGEPIDMASVEMTKSVERLGASGNRYSLVEGSRLITRYATS